MVCTCRLDQRTSLCQQRGLTALMNSAASVALGMPLWVRKPGSWRRVLYTSKTWARLGTLSAAQGTCTLSPHHHHSADSSKGNLCKYPPGRPATPQLLQDAPTPFRPHRIQSTLPYSTLVQHFQQALHLLNALHCHPLQGSSKNGGGGTLMRAVALDHEVAAGPATLSFTALQYGLRETVWRRREPHVGRWC